MKLQFGVSNMTILVNVGSSEPWARPEPSARHTVSHLTLTTAG